LNRDLEKKKEKKLKIVKEKGRRKGRRERDWKMAAKKFKDAMLLRGEFSFKRAQSRSSSQTW